MKRTRWLCAFLHVSLYSATAHSQSFSADLIMSDELSTPFGIAAHIDVENSKVRIATPDLPGDFFIVDAEANSSVLVRPLQRILWTPSNHRDGHSSLSLSILSTLVPNGRRWREPLV